MFQKLRLKLTLINVAVFLTILAILSCVLYLSLKVSADRGTSYILHKISQDVIDKNWIDFPLNPQPKKEFNDDRTFKGIAEPPKPNFFFVRIHPNGEILSHSRGNTISEERLTELAKLVLQSKAEEDALDFAKTKFAYLRTPLQDEQAILIVFNDLSSQIESQNTLSQHLLIVCLLSGLLSFFTSFFLAKKAIQPIQSSLEQQKNFVSDASHELRTPITIIQTNLDILKGAAPEETIADNKKWLDNIQDETTRMTELINTLLFLARADANQQLLEKEYFSLNQLMIDALHPFDLIAKNKTITLTTDINGVFTALGDATRLKQVLTILLDNAIRHTPEHGSIVAKCFEKNEQSYIQIIDTGEGIAKKHLDKIFDRFYQVDESRNNGGSGLGLSMAKWIIEKHGGTINATSIVGKGTTFTIILPTKL